MPKFAPLLFIYILPECALPLLIYSLSLMYSLTFDNLYLFLERVLHTHFYKCIFVPSCAPHQLIDICALMYCNMPNFYPNYLNYPNLPQTI